MKKRIPTIQQLKATVYRKFKVSNTQQLKQKRQDAVQGRDLRRKHSWIALLNWFRANNPINTDSSELYQSLQRVGRVGGKSVADVDTQWEEMQARVRKKISAPDYQITI